MTAMRRAVLVAFIVVAGLPLAAQAKAKKPKERYYVQVVGAETAEGVPKELAEKARTFLPDLLAKRPEFVASLEGAPSDPDQLRKWLAKKKLRGFKLNVKLTRYTREVAPKPDAKGQVLKINISLQLF